MGQQVRAADAANHVVMRITSLWAASEAEVGDRSAILYSATTLLPSSSKVPNPCGVSRSRPSLIVAGTLSLHPYHQHSKYQTSFLVLAELIPRGFHRDANGEDHPESTSPNRSKGSPEHEDAADHKKSLGPVFPPGQQAMMVLVPRNEVAASRRRLTESARPPRPVT